MSGGLMVLQEEILFKKQKNEYTKKTDAKNLPDKSYLT